MAIIGNSPCPACRDNGHDKTGDHLIQFEDGAFLCIRAHLHKDGKKYYAEGSGDVMRHILESEISGEVNYTPAQFKALVEAGKLNTDSLRQLALAGMSAKSRWLVANEDEREAMIATRNHHFNYFNLLKVRNLVSRGITGLTAKRFNTRVGVDPDSNQVTQHYYPVYNMNAEWIGAKCRTLPKNFGYDTLGYTFGDTMLFGQMASIEDFKSGGRKNKLLIVGGECDAMAAWQMLNDADTSGKYKYHVWSPVHGENALQDILIQREAIDQFSEIVLGLDNDPTGQKMNLQISRLFRGKCKFLVYPSGTKDANQCLLEGRATEFISSWFNPAEQITGGFVKSTGELAEKAKVMPEMGKQWPWKPLNKITIGIRENMLFVIGAGSGVGKTHFTKEVCFKLMEEDGEQIGVIYLEEPTIKTYRSYAGRYLGNKRIDVPPNDPDDPESYMVERDYTEEEANWAIDKLDELGLIYIADTGGDKSIDAVMKAIDEMVALGIRRIVIDNLTAITHPSAGTKVDAIDETMKTIGTYKDENPITIFLISHLKRVDGGGSSRKSHAEGGYVGEADFRGAGSITMWANYVLGIERNTQAETEYDKRITTIRCVKDRDFGIFTGHTVKLFGNPDTGALELLTNESGRGLQEAEEKFDDEF